MNEPVAITLCRLAASFVLITRKFSGWEMPGLALALASARPAPPIVAAAETRVTTVTSVLRIVMGLRFVGCVPAGAVSYWCRQAARAAPLMASSAKPSNVRQYIDLATIRR